MKTYKNQQAWIAVDHWREPHLISVRGKYIEQCALGWILDYLFLGHHGKHRQPKTPGFYRWVGTITVENNFKTEEEKYEMMMGELDTETITWSGTLFHKSEWGKE